MAETMRHRIVCCARGYDAQMAGEFIYLPHANAFAFTGEDAPRRELTWRARYYLKDGEPDPTGHPITFVSCVFCGADLPIATAPRIALPPSSTEGSE